MMLLRVFEATDEDEDLVQIFDHSDRFCLHLAGRALATAWLINHGCCPGAASLLPDCEYGQVYSINAAPLVAA